MRLIIRGETTSLAKPETRFAAQWAARELLGKRLSKNIRITITFDDLGDKDYGSCIPCMNDAAHAYRQFKLEINNDSRRTTQLQTLFHEMGHVKQFAREELDYTDDKNLSEWRRKYLIDARQYAYSELPWEKEAFRIQDMLYRRYVAHLRENHISFLDI